MIRAIVRRETSRADRTGREFSVVLFRVGVGRRWSVSTCRMARVLLSRVRQTDDVGWFDERHLCAVLADTPAAGARVFAARTCDEIARRQPRPLSIVYGYPGSMPVRDAPGVAETVHTAPAADVVLHEPVHVNGKGHTVRGARSPRHAHGHANGAARHIGHGHARGGVIGKANGHANGHANGDSQKGGDDDHDDPHDGHAVAVGLAEAPPETGRGLAAGERDQLVGYFLDGVSAAIKRADAPAAAAAPARHAATAAAATAAAVPSAKPDAALEDLFVVPTPAWKRGLDLLGATVGLALLTPVLLIAAVAIKLTSPGPVIFRQRRSGLGGRPFTIYKLRTMCQGAERQQAELRKLNEQDGPAFKLTRDPRVTRVGKLLRKTSIDELPQLLNVIKGDMSLVGPRPLPIQEQDGCQPWQRHRLNVTPGLTCIWQVDGRSTVTFDEWVRMDVAYMRRQSLWRDLSILFRTIPAVLMRRGAR